MLAQINFKLTPTQKRMFELWCETQQVDMAEYLRAFTIGAPEGIFPQRSLQDALVREEQEMPETRGRKPKPLPSPVHHRKTIQVLEEPRQVARTRPSKQLKLQKKQKTIKKKAA